jgi:hypothetical protein
MRGPTPSSAIPAPPIAPDQRAMTLMMEAAEGGDVEAILLAVAQKTRIGQIGRFSLLSQ